MNSLRDPPHPDGPADSSADDLLGLASAASLVPSTRRRRRQGSHVPRRLLDLSQDVLETIIGHITHTNDLCSLALTCSALHTLATPHIYSRFDIVWPEVTPQSDPRSGVDALTYGLSTLVMAAEVYGETAPTQPTQQSVTCTACGHVNPPPPPPAPLSDHSLKPQPVPRLLHRRGNHYAQYTRKFSLGNGPRDWVQEYMVYKEAGKLLGTQVALAVARMRNLEQFIWDMPTGVLREVWQSLASLADHRDGRSCRLEKVWIRWHNNQTLQGDQADYHDHASQSHNHATATATVAAPAITSDPIPNLTNGSEWKCDHPTFSILPPLKSINVVDIDERDYLLEISNLILKSRNILRELRIGIAHHRNAQDWDFGLVNRDPQSSSSQSTLALQPTSGALGILFRQIFSVSPNGINRQPAAVQTLPLRDGSHATPTATSDETATKQRPTTPSLKHTGPKFVEDLPDNSHRQRTFSQGRKHDTDLSPAASSASATADNLAGRLSLEVLELERVPLAVFTLREAIDWSKIREITLLDCPRHEQLWKSLKRQFAPAAPPKPSPWNSTGASLRAISPPPAKSSKHPASAYTLDIRKIHTNTVTPALVQFIVHALPPNSLESLFLQISSAQPPLGTAQSATSIAAAQTLEASQVTIDQLHRGPLRRHRESLQKVCIDSSKKTTGGRCLEPNPRAHCWLVNRPVLEFITSGRMPRLRELCICIDRADWHFLLQRLPFIPHLRSLYIPYMRRDTDAPVNENNVRELAQYILDTVVLRPEVELCYLGIYNKCYEILEGKWSERDLEHASTHADSVSDDERDMLAADFGDADEDDDDDANEDGDEDADETPEGDAGVNDTTEEESDHDLDEYDSDMERVEAKSRVRLREILFYDDKVAIFKARHGHL